MKAKKQAKVKKTVEESMVGKTIASATYDGEGLGYGRLRLVFTDGSTAFVNYSCMGGVFCSHRENGD
jgi:hypothetical protein